MSLDIFGKDLDIPSLGLGVNSATLFCLFVYRSEGFALTGYVVPGCVEDGTWMLWENSSVVVVAAVLARSFLDNFSEKSLFLVIFHEKLTFGDIYF